ncbi:hypothetical protein D5086_006019 [Populus alba]|uniref:Uncharacterized protein n=1 Tax=Populus alba TaxID=43335 RepID=A0ACC4CKR2_POPAL
MSGCDDISCDIRTTMMTDKWSTAAVTTSSSTSPGQINLRFLLTMYFSTAPSLSTNRRRHRHRSNHSNPPSLERSNNKHF